jgi:hypothetical protein
MAHTNGEIIINRPVQEVQPLGVLTLMTQWWPAWADARNSASGPASSASWKTTSLPSRLASERLSAAPRRFL